MAHPQRRDAPVLFLDVDGVLNIATATAVPGGFSTLHTSLLDRLARVVRRSRARVVLASSWRHDRQRLTLLERAWRLAQLPPLDAVTPTHATTTVLSPDAEHSSAAGQRVLEIRQWLQETETIGRWATIDDLDLAAADTANQAKYVQTDPRCGLSVNDADKLLDLLKGEEDEEEWTILRPLPPVSQLLQLAVDLLVVQSLSMALVIDCADFSIAARLDTTQQTLRQWLRTQEAEFSLDRIATICLHHEDAMEPTTSIHLNWTADDGSPEEFVSMLMGDATTNGVGPIQRLVEASEARDLTDWGGIDAVARQLRHAGVSDDVATQLISDPRLAMCVLDALSTLKLLSRLHTDLTVAIWRIFPQPHDRKLRKVLVEYVARGELTSTATMDAIKLLWMVQPGNWEELDELIGGM